MVGVWPHRNEVGNGRGIQLDVELDPLHAGRLKIGTQLADNHRLLVRGNVQQIERFPQRAKVFRRWQHDEQRSAGRNDTREFGRIPGRKYVEHQSGRRLGRLNRAPDIRHRECCGLIAARRHAHGSFGYVKADKTRLRIVFV